jgi:hypothetical protein
MAKKKCLEDPELIITGKRKAISSAHLKASIKNGETHSASDDDLETPKKAKKAKKEGKKQKPKGKAN